MKSFRKIGVVALLFAVITLWSPRSEAELVLQFGQSGEVGLTEFTARAGEIITLDLFVTQRGTIEFQGQTFPDRRLTFDGVGSAFAKLNIAGGTDVSFPSDVSTAFAYGDGFEGDGNTAVSDAQLTIGAYGIVNDADEPVTDVEPVKPPEGSDSVLLGKATMQINRDAVGSYDLQLSSVNADITGSPDFSLGPNPTANAVDVLTGSATLNVTAIPEANSIAFLTVASVTGLAWFRRNRRDGDSR